MPRIMFSQVGGASLIVAMQPRNITRCMWELQQQVAAQDWTKALQTTTRKAHKPNDVVVATYIPEHLGLPTPTSRNSRSMSRVGSYRFMARGGTAGALRPSTALDPATRSNPPQPPEVFYTPLHSSKAVGNSQYNTKGAQWEHQGRP